ncbi:GNAT family N-acetyltransferase (plasmid) [Haladaptatus sp. SPP-AMP-3]|uniref:GNAT family N-acetyltransferase n=1 Tax=Haladaptatus sp. SPP-AMP-3 TaxID=3121295 RepID=UPI003C2F06AC
MPDYRPIPAIYEDEYRRFLRYAFEPENGLQADEDDDDESELGDRRGVFDGDDLRCVCKHYWFTARIRGDWHEMAGLSAVASPPESRRRGLVRDMLAESLAEYRENEVYFSALWPFSYEFYRKYGWATANKHTKYETTPDALDLDIEPAGEFRPLDADDWELLVPAFDAMTEGYALSTDRTEDWWRERIFKSWKRDPYVYAWMREDEARGFIVYTVHDEGDGKRFKVWELTAMDDEAYRHLLRFVQYHDSQVETVELTYVPESTDLLDIVANPRDVDCEINAGPMFRLVDVPRALESIAYDADATVVLRVTDPLAAWNEGTFELDTDDVVRCERTDADPDVTIDVNTLSQLVVGYHAVEDAERFGNLTVETGDARATLAELFPERDVFLTEGF